jgi:hypothetical protein
LFEDLPARFVVRCAAAQCPVVFLLQVLRKFFNDFRLPHRRQLELGQARSDLALEIRHVEFR